MAALSTAEVAHFEAFGFVLRRACLGAAEMAELRAAAEAAWDRPSGPHLETPGGSRSVLGALTEFRAPDFAEQVARVAVLAGDARVLEPAAQLLGDDFVWGGSEGNCSACTTFGWHADRKYWGPPELSADGGPGWPEACGRGNAQRDLSLCAFPQLKMSLYLDPLTRETGCFRCIPASHRPPLFAALGPQECAGNRWGAAPDPEPFGVEASKLPSYAVESQPGDLIIWHSCLWHGVYVESADKLPLQSDNLGRERRYLALKFSAMPCRPAEFSALHKYMQFFSRQ